ncbi:MAG: hypothetical protein JRF33_23265, partial [Deltaproteobacteria bacterium]|nr:hypothetical protein [Deltaproteobacteria bacterium]
CLPNDFDSTTTCGDAGADCVNQDLCDGSGACSDNGYWAEDTSCTDIISDDCELAECDGMGACVQGHAYAAVDTPCEAFDPCMTGDVCSLAGNCLEGGTPKDDDLDSHVDDACGGDDCDDTNPDIYPNAPAEGPGKICDIYASCFDGVDNDCDGNTDSDDGDCQATGFMCLYGPGTSSINGPGDTLTVRLDTNGYDPTDIVCYTDNDRLLSSTDLFSEDFQSGTGSFVTAGTVGTGSGSQNPDTADASNTSGLYLNSDGASITSGSIDTTGLTRIQLRYASRANGTENGDPREYCIAEYSPDAGGSWYPLSLSGDGYDEHWQWYTHILPTECENISGLQVRFRMDGLDATSDYCFFDDIAVSDMPSPTVSWAVLSNHFETSEGNTAADECVGETIVGFNQQGNNNAEVCLLAASQNPSTADGENEQGVRIVDNDPSYLEDTVVDTSYVPTGSDLVVQVAMSGYNFSDEGYGNLWYYDGSDWLRTIGLGGGTTEGWIDYRFILGSSTIGLTNAAFSFWINTTAQVSNAQGMELDDFDLVWYRASLDEISGFTNEGDGTYTAIISSDTMGAADVTCIYHGTSTEVTDGSGVNSSPQQVIFVP